MWDVLIHPFFILRQSQLPAIVGYCDCFVFQNLTASLKFGKRKTASGWFFVNFISRLDE